MKIATKALINYVSEETGKRIGLRGENTFIDIATGNQIEGSIVEKCMAKKKAEDIEAEKNQGLKEINDWYELEASKLTRGYPNTEISTWDKQEREAREFLKDNTAETPFIRQLAEARGIEINELVDKIILKANNYTVSIGTLTGERQKKEKELLESLK